MKMKRLALLSAILLFAAVLTGCAGPASVTVADQKLSYLKTDITDGYAGIVPQPGNQILTIKFLSETSNPDLSKISEAFFGQNPSVLSDGANTYPCKSIAFENDGGKLIVIPVFEVPSSLQTGSSTLTLSGSSFTAIEFKI